MRIVGGKYRGKKLMAPTHGGTRPTSDRTRETIFNILLHNPLCGPRALQDKTVLDAFAGTGALGLEAYSRGAKSVTFIENNKAILPILHSNIRAFDLPASCVLEQDVHRLSINTGAPFDILFMDPPYHQDMIPMALEQLESKGWIAEEALIIIELAKEETLLLPPTLSLVMERTSGAAKLLFCSVHT